MVKKKIATFLGPQLGLSIAGEHAYALSGEKQINTSNVEHLNFVTGNYIFVGKLTFTGPIKMDDIATGFHAGAEVSFNNIALFKLKNDTGAEDMPTDNVVPIIIPPNTAVSIEVVASNSTAGFTTSINLTGRIYNV